MSSYWQRVTVNRVSRRRALIGGASAAGASALLLACGGGGDDSAGLKREGRISLPDDTSKQAKKGGIYQQDLDDDEGNLDPLSTGRGNGGAWAPLAYSRPLTEKTQFGGTETPVHIGDLAESYEIQEGGLRLVMKLRPGAKWDPRAPTNSRIVDTEDVLYSWDRYVKLSPFAAKLSYEASKGAAPIERVERIDNRTYAYKLAYPWSPLLPSLTNAMGWIMPREAEDKFDPRNTVRGSGPWMLDKYQPSVGFNWIPNPNWHGKSVYGTDAPYLDGINQIILKEYNSFLGQFRAGSIWDGSSRAKTEDVIQIAKEFPDVNIFRGQPGNGVPNIIFMTEPGSPWLDVRRRRAVSMALDRDLLANVASGNDVAMKEGVPLDPEVNGFLGRGWGGYTLKARSKELGEGAANLMFNVAEGKKLMSAAGTPTLNQTIAFTTQYIDEKWASVIAEMLQEVGIHSALKVVDYRNVMLLANGGILYSKGQFSQHGDMSFSSGGADADPAATLFKIWHTDGSTSRANIKDAAGLEINAVIDKAVRTFEPETYLSLIHDVQRKLAVHVPSLPYFYSVSALNPVQPWVMNWNAIRNSLEGTGLLNVWYDESKKKA
jgi:ABC-type transport system substrate-binding protein